MGVLLPSLRKLLAMKTAQRGPVQVPCAVAVTAPGSLDGTHGGLCYQVLVNA